MIREEGVLEYGEEKCGVITRRWGTHGGATELEPLGIAESEDIECHHEAEGGHEGIDRLHQR